MPQWPRRFGDSGNTICEDPSHSSTTGMSKCRTLPTPFLSIRIHVLPSCSRTAIRAPSISKAFLYDRTRNYMPFDGRPHFSWVSSFFSFFFNSSRQLSSGHARTLVSQSSANICLRIGSKNQRIWRLNPPDLPVLAIRDFRSGPRQVANALSRSNEGSSKPVEECLLMGIPGPASIARPPVLSNELRRPTYKCHKAPCRAAQVMRSRFRGSLCINNVQRGGERLTDNSTEQPELLSI